jgi:hypothetical protein
MATHKIEDSVDGLFTISPMPDATIGDEAKALAGAIEGALEFLRRNVSEIKEERIKRLRQIAFEALASQDPDLGAAWTKLEQERFLHASVRPVGEFDIEVNLPKQVDEKSVAFPLRFQNVERLARQLHTPRSNGAGGMLGTTLNLPRMLLEKLAPPAQPKPRLAPPLPDPESSYKECRAELVRAARFAFPDPRSVRMADFDIAGKLLDVVLQNAVEDRGPTARREYLRSLATGFLVVWLLGMAALTVGWVSWNIAEACCDMKAPPCIRLIILGVALAFLFLGAWLSTAQRLNNAQEAVIRSVFAEPFQPLLRGAVLFCAGLLVLFLLHLDVAGANLGGNTLATKQILTSVPTAMVIGALLGFSERLLPGLLTTRSQQLVQQLGAIGQTEAPGGAAPGQGRAQGRNPGQG